MSTNDPWSSPHRPEGSDPDANPYESNPYESNPYESNPYGPNPYGPNPYGPNPYGPNPYGPPGPYQPMPHPGYYGALPKHPGVSTALVLSLVSLAGFACIIPFLTAPIGMILGLKAHREIKEQPDRWSGDGEAMAAFVVGLVITVLLLLIVIGVVVAVALSPDTY
ncbi:MAG: DUF4190 domain-containing protein [Propionibacteriaceae bacterium]